MFDVLTPAGLFEAILSLVAVCGAVTAFAKRNGAQEAKTLKRENQRLRNIVANLMIDNAQVRDTR